MCSSCYSVWNNLEKSNKEAKLLTKKPKLAQTKKTLGQAVKTYSVMVHYHTFEINIPGSSIPNGWLAWSEPPTILNPKGLFPFFKMISWKQATNFKSLILPTNIIVVHFFYYLLWEFGSSSKWDSCFFSLEFNSLSLLAAWQLGKGVSH